MIATYNSVDNQIQITSPVITDIINSVSGFTLDITVSVNGGTEVLFEDILLVDLDVPNGRFEINPADLSVDVFENGVYTLKLTKTLTGGSKTYESYCLFIDIDFTCKVVDNISTILTDTDSVIYTLGIFNLLKNIDQCEECNCTNALTLWNEINYKLGLKTNTNDCGCN
jgi:hypothetical protein